MHTIRFRAEEDPTGGGAPAPAEVPAEPTPPAEAPAPQWAPSQEEWQQTQAALRAMAQMVQQPQYEQEQEYDPEDVDIDSYINQRVQQMIAPMVPMYEATIKDQGEKRLRELHDEYAAQYGDFDRELAEAFAQKLIGSPSVGQNAVKAVEEGVKKAVAVAERERKAGEEAYRASLKRGGHDFEPSGGGGSGEKRIPQPKTVEEVIAKWQGETEV